MTKISLTLIAAGALCLGACMKSDEPATSANATAPNDLLEAAVKEAKTRAATAALPQPDPDKALSSYAELDSGVQLMFHYIAASKLPPKFEEMAQTYSSEYRRSTDSFRKNDLLKALKPQLEQEIERARAEPYAWMEIDDPNLGAYDFDQRGFPVGEFGGGGARYFSDASSYKLTWANHDKLKFAPVADEAVARELESMRNDWGNKPRMRVYFFGQSADLNGTTLNAFVTRVQLVSKSGKVLAEYAPES